jgi:hypothetical protein
MIKPIKILKKLDGSFRFYKHKIEKTEPKKIEPNQEKPSKTGLNRFLS